MTGPCRAPLGDPRDGRVCGVDGLCPRCAALAEESPPDPALAVAFAVVAQSRATLRALRGAEVPADHVARVRRVVRAAVARALAALPG